jgi:hypothetical protein
MHKSYQNSGTRSAANWEAEIKTAQQELRLHGHEMSPYERNVISREIKRRQDELIPVVGGMVIGEFHQAIGKYKASEQLMQAERTKEINRFDSAKLNTEIQLMQTRVQMATQKDKNVLRGDNPGISAQLQQVYSEAIQSGDLHKQRAAIEVIKSVSLPGGQERGFVNDLARQAERAEVEFRQTEGTRNAQQARMDALGELHAKHEQLDKVSQLLGMGAIDDPFNPGPFAKAAKMVEFTAEGPVIYDENDPAVTGVLWTQSAIAGG